MKTIYLKIMNSTFYDILHHLKRLRTIFEKYSANDNSKKNWFSYYLEILKDVEDN